MFRQLYVVKGPQDLKTKIKINIESGDYRPDLKLTLKNPLKIP